MNSNETLTSTQPYNLPNYRPIDQLANLDYHIVHSCNLACYGCNHWTDIYSLKGQIPAEIYEKEVRQWVNKLLEVDLQYETFNILGGEPLMHSNLMQILDYTVDIFKNTTTSVGLVTNGLLWHKYPTLFEYCLDNKIRIRLSVHVKASSNNKEFITQLTPILNDFKKYKMPLSELNRLGPASLSKSYGNDWQLNRNKNLQPFYSDPKKAYDHCIQKQCQQLFNNKLYKCSQIAYLESAVNALSQEYDRYVKMYSPLDFDCSTDELFEFLSRSEEPICEMCPDKTVTSNIIPVVDKIKKITYNMY